MSKNILMEVLRSRFNECDLPLSSKCNTMMKNYPLLCQKLRLDEYTTINIEKYLFPFFCFILIVFRTLVNRFNIILNRLFKATGRLHPQSNVFIIKLLN